MWWMLAAFLVAGVVGCQTSKPAVITKDYIDTGLFKHSEHVGDSGEIRKLNGGKLLECQDCHAVDKSNQFKVQRPGLDNHAPCDQCHSDEFYKEPGDFCTVCHQSVDPLIEAQSPLGEYPRRAVAAQLVSAFNHQVHLEGARVKLEGKQLDCGNCHTVESQDSPYATFPKHANCAPCHSEVVSPVLDDCDGCHSDDGPGKKRGFIQNDIRFTHGKHQTDKAGKPISCETCHYGVPKSSSSRDLNLPLMKDCAKCHEDKTKTPDRVRISECGVCHTGDVNSVKLPGNHTASIGGPLGDEWLALNEAASLDLFARIAINAPGSLLADALPPQRVSLQDLTPKGEPILADISGLVVTQRDNTTSTKPEDHSPLFRFNHGEAASSPNAKCGYCHTGLSGSPRDSCRDCHSTWKPRNHTIRWRGVEHGRQAALDPQRCGTCHEVDFCTECHSVAPPNHSPIATFRYRHGRAARFNSRSCATCHTFESTCIDCHQLNVTPTAGAAQNPLRRLR